MANVLLFHHALGLTAGVVAFADRLRAAGHRVTAPDLYDGRTFATVADGVAHAEAVGFAEVVRRGVAAAADLPAAAVYAGFSLGVLPAQTLAQTRTGALAAVLYHAAVPPADLGSPWPAGVALQMHLADRDPLSEADLIAAGQLARDVPGSELFVYPTAAHLVADPGAGEYDAAVAEQVVERTLRFLARWP